MTKRLLVIVFLLASTTTFAKTHEDSFEAPCDKVWAAVRQVLMHSGKYGILFMSNEDMTASYNIGGYLGGKRTNSVQLRPNGTGCTMSVQTAFTGLAHNDSGDFLHRVTDALSQNPAPTSPAPNPSGGAPPPPPATPATPDAGAPPQAAPGQLSSVVIKSNPDGADITVDANYVGSTPSTVKLAPGDHVIKVEKPGFKAWQRSVTVSPGSDLTINANLEKDLNTASQAPQGST